VIGWNCSCITRSELRGASCEDWKSAFIIQQIEHDAIPWGGGSTFLAIVTSSINIFSVCWLANWTRTKSGRLSNYTAKPSRRYFRPPAMRARPWDAHMLFLDTVMQYDWQVLHREQKSTIVLYKYLVINQYRIFISQHNLYHNTRNFVKRYGRSMKIWLG
jgi:hypothetical protein